MRIDTRPRTAWDRAVTYTHRVVVYTLCVCAAALITAIAFNVTGGRHPDATSGVAVSTTRWEVDSPRDQTFLTYRFFVNGLDYTVVDWSKSYPEAKAKALIAEQTQARIAYSHKDPADSWVIRDSPHHP